MALPKLLSRPWIWLLVRITKLWIRPAILPERPASLLSGPDTPVCYVLEYGGLADRLALEQACRRSALAAPDDGVVFCGVEEATALIVLRAKQGRFLRRSLPKIPARLERFVSAGSAAGGDDLELIPVAVYWGRAPEREKSWLKLLFSEQWEIGGRLRRFLATILYGRNTLVQFSEPLSLRRILDEGLEAEIAARKISRILRVHFRQRRIATLGPDLSHRRTLVNEVLRSPAVREAVRAETQGNALKLDAVRREAREYAREIAADMSYPMVRFLDKLLTWLWNQLYDGIRLHGMDRVSELAEGRELVYVPCHRSHFDYLLLSYVLYHQGLSLPYVAAGVNLNLPVVGSILRSGGGFFLRRSFRGNRLYAAVFYAYLQALITRGYSIEYFVEGGRSRTGRLLRPKGGMLVMTVESYLREPRRPLVFVPIYFGYEKLVEGRSFINELSGEAKKKETVLGLLRSVTALRVDFGEVYVNVGEPVMLPELLDRHRPGWRDETPAHEERPDWLAPVIEELELEIMQRINAAAAVTPISLLALALLATPRQTMVEATLRRQLALMLDLLAALPYGAGVTRPELEPEQMIAHGVDLGVVRREEHPLGDLILMRDREAVLMTYFRNNVLHLFAVPGMVAACFIQNRRLAEDEVVRLVRLVYPYVRNELFLRWGEEAAEATVRDAIERLCDLELLRRSEDAQVLARPRAGSERAFQLVQLGRLTLPMLQRYYMTIALLDRYGSGQLTQNRLERLCELSAQRLSVVYVLRSPDFFDRKLFQEFIRGLRTAGVLATDESGNLVFDAALARVEEDARQVLGEQVCHSILSITVAEILVDEE